MTPLLRVATVGAIGCVLLLAGGGVAYYVARHPAEGYPARSRVASTPATRASLPGDRMLPDVEDAYAQAEQHNRSAAERTAGAGASVPPLDVLQPAETPQATHTLRPGEAAALSRQHHEQLRAQDKERQQRTQEKAQGMAKVLATWGGIHQTAEATLPAPVPAPRETAAAVGVERLANLPVDRVYYGLLRVYISSDEPGPVVVTIKDGALDSARLIGSFKRADEKVVIHFDRMTLGGAWYSVDAYAIDPANGRLGLATAVDRRTFTRWAALLGSAILQGVQRAYLSQGTQSNYLWGQTHTSDFTDQEILGIALGEIGTRTRQAATEYFNRPPTVYVDPAIQLVGVLFMGPPSRKQDGAPVVALATRSPLVAPPSDALQATAAPADPSATVPHDARQPAAWPRVPAATPPAE